MVGNYAHLAALLLLAPPEAGPQPPAQPVDAAAPVAAATPVAPAPATAPAPAPPAAAPAPAPPAAAPAPAPPAAAPAPPPATPPPAARPREHHNPRAATRFTAAAQLWGPTLGLGVLAEYMPHWVASVGLGVGGTVREIGNGVPRGAGTFFGELALLPVPFAVTPVLGGGFAFTFGPAAEHLPGFAGRPPDRDQFVRLLPYARLGLRVDLRARLWLAAHVLLAPDNRFDQGYGIHPLPGFRIGYALR